jgi:predicted DNA-binding transcriptional regulator YafY
MTATEQLTRILYALPAAARDGGIPLIELASALNVDVRTVLDDLEQVTSRAYYHPAATVDPFTILIEDDRVHVHAPREFTRPTRLTPPEALALGLGLRALASEADRERRDQILALAEQIERELMTPEVQVRMQVSEDAIAYMSVREPPEPVVSVELGEAEFRAALLDAIESSRVCQVSYLKAGEQGTAERTIAPRRLIYDQGRWYVAAYDLERQATRRFRLDRMLEVVPLPVRFDWETVEQGEAESAERGQSYWAEDDAEETVTVRYSPRVARWVTEQIDAEPQSDGSVCVQHDVSDSQWLIRHIVQYGGEAVVETQPYRRLVAEAMETMSH